MNSRTNRYFFFASMPVKTMDIKGVNTAMVSGVVEIDNVVSSEPAHEFYGRICQAIFERLELSFGKPIIRNQVTISQISLIDSFESDFRLTANTSDNEN